AEVAYDLIVRRGRGDDGDDPPVLPEERGSGIESEVHQRHLGFERAVEDDSERVLADSLDLGAAPGHDDCPPVESRPPGQPAQRVNLRRAVRGGLLPLTGLLLLALAALAVAWTSPATAGDLRPSPDAVEYGL